MTGPGRGDYLSGADRGRAELGAQRLPHQRTSSRTGSPAAGAIELGRRPGAADPKLRARPILASLLERRHRQVHGHKGCSVTIARLTVRVGPRRIHSQPGRQHGRDPPSEHRLRGPVRAGTDEGRSHRRGQGMCTTERAGAHSLQFGTYALWAAELLAALAVRPVPSCDASLTHGVNDQPLSDMCSGQRVVDRSGRR